MIDPETAAELDQLAARVATIRPMSNSNPHAFYEERSEVASKLRLLASRLRNRVPQAEAAPAPAPIGRQRISRESRTIEGREIPISVRRQAFLAH